MGLFRDFLNETVINLDKGDDPTDIKVKSTVIINKKKYVCYDDMGDNGSFLLKDKKNDKFIYRSSNDSIEPY